MRISLIGKIQAVYLQQKFSFKL